LLGRTDLNVIRNGVLNVIQYRDENLHPVLRLFASAVDPGFVLMDDNAHPHHAQVAIEYLERESTQRTLWDQLQHQISQRQDPPMNLHQSETVLGRNGPTS